MLCVKFNFELFSEKPSTIFLRPTLTGFLRHLIWFETNFIQPQVNLFFMLLSSQAKPTIIAIANIKCSLCSYVWV